MSDKKNINVPFFSTSRVNSKFDLSSIAQQVIDSYWYILGNEVNEFEKEFADYLNIKHCISVANGTDALTIALKTVGVSRGDKVITTANAGFYSSTAIYAVDAEPIYVDIDTESLTMSFADFVAALDCQPKAVIVTHLYGKLSPAIKEIAALAKEKGIKVIEDCAQAHGAKNNNRHAGTFGDVACFSFYPTKNLGALGDGGAIVTSHDEFAVNARHLRQYGWTEKYHVTVKDGQNSRLDELQAAFLRAKLPFLDESNEERRQIAQRYNSEFSKLPLVLPALIDEGYVAHLYVIQSEHRDELAIYLKNNGVSCDIHYPVPDHLQSAYNYRNPIKLTRTERVCEKIISLPCYQGMDETHIDKVISTVCDFFRRG
ncbi:DegT/DnrJ/EryC1/StrS family aminotransferase [Kosakonia pseudosacchari]|uniref:DegT/DnrJ/EryC1/StrS family aminotransferase n=1 Tax=Kosakonia pseudosacchari TaxID=1646340 RepID=UPI0022F1247A|nr:DegT/DnrJ/EryC1/StrS family aminotransferase [Kosakonia pseudosacchari]WBU48992.1 DegT/DnrJ/EryC1/StrS family aminotransferase [Kosakonia pseudosacchari]